MDYYSSLPKPSHESVAFDILNDSGYSDNSKYTKLADTIAKSAKDYSLTGYHVFGRQENKLRFLERVDTLQKNLDVF